MNFPDKVKVGAHEYKVLIPYKFRERSDYQGQADHSLLEIRVNEDDFCGVRRAETKILGTFIHEVIHCISETWEIGLEEKQVIQLEEGFLAVLIDNGWVKVDKHGKD